MRLTIWQDKNRFLELCHCQYTHKKTVSKGTDVRLLETIMRNSSNDTQQKNGGHIHSRVCVYENYVSGPIQKVVICGSKRLDSKKANEILFIDF